MGPGPLPPPPVPGHLDLAPAVAGPCRGLERVLLRMKVEAWTAGRANARAWSKDPQGRREVATTSAHLGPLVPLGQAELVVSKEPLKLIPGTLTRTRRRRSDRNLRRKPRSPKELAGTGSRRRRRAPAARPNELAAPEPRREVSAGAPPRAARGGDRRRLCGWSLDQWCHGARWPWQSESGQLQQQGSPPRNRNLLAGWRSVGRTCGMTSTGRSGTSTPWFGMGASFGRLGSGGTLRSDCPSRWWAAGAPRPERWWPAGALQPSSDSMNHGSSSKALTTSTSSPSSPTSATSTRSTTLAFQSPSRHDDVTDSSPSSGMTTAPSTPTGHTAASGLALTTTDTTATATAPTVETEDATASAHPTPVETATTTSKASPTAEAAGVAAGAPPTSAGATFVGITASLVTGTAVEVSAALPKPPELTAASTSTLPSRAGAPHTQCLAKHQTSASEGATVSVKDLVPDAQGSSRGLSSSPDGASAAEQWIEAIILQAYEELDDLSKASAASMITPSWSVHRMTLRWVTRKLEQLRLRLIRREVSPLEINSARPMIEASLRSLRTHQCLGPEEGGFSHPLGGRGGGIGHRQLLRGGGGGLAPAVTCLSGAEAAFQLLLWLIFAGLLAQWAWWDDCWFEFNG